MTEGGKKTASGFLWWAKRLINFLQGWLEEMKNKIDEKEENSDIDNK